MERVDDDARAHNSNGCITSVSVQHHFSESFRKGVRVLVRPNPLRRLLHNFVICHRLEFFEQNLWVDVGFLQLLHHAGPARVPAADVCRGHMDIHHRFLALARDVKDTHRALGIGVHDNVDPLGEVDARCTVDHYVHVLRHQRVVFGRQPEAIRRDIPPDCLHLLLHVSVPVPSLRAQLFQRTRRSNLCLESCHGVFVFLCTNHDIHRFQIWNVAQELVQNTLPDKPRSTNHEHCLATVKILNVALAGRMLVNRLVGVKRR
mmetsp:Transcript_66062/g.137672  ORF Transcript_66062/g.137672 Transcript_66062/m.137672 type:complete len:261 (+) Transcript_66062:1051-1833(+)